jgi:N-acetylglucosaminyldiphosphoundecaprenol N-acetyl-beta-D-mannosaminyltransferase
MLKSDTVNTVFTPNPEILEHAASDGEFAKILNSADLSLPDGVGVLLASKLLGTPVYERIPGIDAGSALLCLAQKKREKVFFLGAAPGVAEKAECELKKKYKDLIVTGRNHGYFSSIENDSILQKINDSGASILFVCLGSPKQEKWIYENKERLKNVRIAIALGGSLDVYSKNVKRAPDYMQKAGLEWLWRIVFLRGRSKRAGKLPGFCFRVLKETFVHNFEK